MSIRKRIQDMKGNNKLENNVIDWLLESDGEIKTRLSDLLQHGCVSGMVNHLIYYSDTHKFFNDFQDEIFELIEEYEEMIGEELKPKDDKRNWYSWFAFEETARKISDKLEGDDQ